MIGVDIVGLNVLMKKFDYVNDDTKKKIKKISSLIDDIADCYVGSSVNAIYSLVDKQRTNLSKISSLTDSYLKTLGVLRETYIFQENVFSSDIEDSIKKIQ